MQRWQRWWGRRQRRDHDAEGRTGFYAESYTGGDLKVLRSGSVNTDVALPSRLPYLGTNAVDVATDTSLAIAGSGFRLAAGDTTVSNAAGPVTGIRVRPGVTLTLRPNWDSDDADVDGNAATGTREEVRIALSDGLLVEGTIRIATMDATTAGDGAGTNTASFRPTVGGFYVASSGKVDVSGAANVAGPGGDGGYFYAHCDAFNSAGTITTSGGSGTSAGGRGNTAEVDANEGYAVSTGSIAADGGAASAGAGGRGGLVDIESISAYGYVVLKGRISGRGGDGTDGGGPGGFVYSFTDHGAMIASATFDLRGGDATTNGGGGSGGSFELETHGSTRVAGSIDTHGGNGAGGGDGAGAGFVTVIVYENASSADTHEPDSGALAFGASVNANGGDGASGGSGGALWLDVDPGDSTTMTGSPVQLVGYSTMTTPVETVRRTAETRGPPTPSGRTRPSTRTATPSPGASTTRRAS